MAEMDVNRHKKKKQNIRNQVVIPLFIAMGLLIIVVEAGLIYINLQKALKGSEGGMEQALDYIADTMKEYAAIGLLMFFLMSLIGGYIRRLLRKAVVYPLQLEQELITAYGKDKDAKKACEGLAKIRSNNELETLAESFSDMVKELESHLEVIERVSREREYIRAELSIASDIQRSLLPSGYPAFPGKTEFDLYALMDPAQEVGGDFYDYFLLDEDHLAIVIADVSDKGIPAALFAVSAKQMLKSRALSGGSPAEIITDVNRMLYKDNKAGMFITLWFGVLSLSTGKGVYVNAGHPDPVFIRKGEASKLSKYRHCPILAAFENTLYKEQSFELDPGDVLLLYTDGVTEAADISESFYGTERLLQILNKTKEKSVTEVLDAVREDIRGYAAGTTQYDDITMLILRFLGGNMPAGDTA